MKCCLWLFDERCIWVTLHIRHFITFPRTISLIWAHSSQTYDVIPRQGWRSRRPGKKRRSSIMFSPVPPNPGHHDEGECLTHQWYLRLHGPIHEHLLASHLSRILWTPVAPGIFRALFCLIWVSWAKLNQLPWWQTQKNPSLAQWHKKIVFMTCPFCLLT